MRFFTLLFFFISIAGCADNAKAEVPERSPRAVVHLLDYLAQDYGGAVANGQIISQSEYKEQLEFSETALETNSSLKETKDHPDVQEKLKTLSHLIQSKASPDAVAKLAQEIKTEVIKVSGLEVSPTQWPNLSHGQELYRNNCVTCHGTSGDGNGPAASALNPKPANFIDEKRMAEISPFQAFNTIRLGVNGTAMTPFPKFTDGDVWALAFYINSLRHQWKVPANLKADAPDAIQPLYDQKTLKQVAIFSDRDLAQTLPGSDRGKTQTIALLRTHSGSENLGNTLQIARNLLHESLNEYKAGHADVAKTKALMAYLEGVEPVEPRLKASDPSATAELEMRMGFVRDAIESKKSEGAVTEAMSSANAQLDLAEKLLGASAPSAWVTFAIASAIILREGFEAVLLIIAFLGVIRASGSKEAALWVHGGWLAAIFLGVLAWFFSGWLMGISGAQRELMEGATSIFAVLVLLYMGFWLHSRTEIGRWKSFIDGRVTKALEGSNLIGLSVISFIAVFREAFETVLFLRALWLEGGMETKTALLTGVIGTLCFVIVLAALILRFTTRIPIRQLFDYSSALMALLAFILVGKGIHSLQETGVVGVSASPLHLRFELFGFYPTLETTLAQAAVLILTLFLWSYGKRPSRPKQTSAAV